MGRLAPIFDRGMRKVIRLGLPESRFLGIDFATVRAYMTGVE
jgi:hypothetical protein